MNKIKSYLITDPKYYGSKTDDLQYNLINTINKHQIDFICFRDKNSKNHKDLATVFVQTCKKQNLKNIFLNTHIYLAKELNCTGVHLNSQQFNEISTAKNLGLKTIISCHTQKDIDLAKKYKTDFITYSPIFASPGKKDLKGIEDLKNIINKNNDINIFALGGIVTTEHILQIQETNAYGFASIRYFI